MTGTPDTASLDYESAVEQFCMLVLDRVANAEPGAVLFNIPGVELVAAMTDFPFPTPVRPWPLAVGALYRV